MNHCARAEIEDRPHHAHADPARASASGVESLLDHHLEELLAAFTELDQLHPSGKRGDSGLS